MRGKRKKWAAVGLLVLSLLTVVGCGVNKEKESGYVFPVADSTLLLNENMNTVTQLLGEPANGIFESENCVFGGKDYYYYYSGYTLCAYEKEQERFLYSIILEDDTNKTAQQVGIGDSLEAVTQAYGTEYTMTGNSTYVYKKGNMTLSFLVENGKVTKVTYLLNEK